MPVDKDRELLNFTKNRTIAPLSGGENNWQNNFYKTYRIIKFVFILENLSTFKTILTNEK
jgi:hypothetical protein